MRLYCVQLLDLPYEDFNKMAKIRINFPTTYIIQYDGLNVMQRLQDKVRLSPGMKASAVQMEKNRWEVNEKLVLQEDRHFLSLSPPLLSWRLIPLLLKSVGIEGAQHQLLALWIWKGTFNFGAVDWAKWGFRTQDCCSRTWKSAQRKVVDCL